MRAAGFSIKRQQTGLLRTWLQRFARVYKTLTDARSGGRRLYWGEPTVMDNLGERLAAVRDRIARAAGRAHRDPASVLLLAVTKVFPASAIREAYQLGLRDFGENYVQEFEGKAPAVADLAGARFHLIGHLQSNKTKKAAELFAAIQTVDSGKLARRLNEAGRALDVMIEVKLSPEEAKHGAAPAELPDLIAAVRACGNLRLSG